MYFIIRNKESVYYKNLHALRTKEIRMDEDNLKAIKDRVKLDFKDYVGYRSQETLSRTAEYIAFLFTEPEKVDLKLWKPDRHFPKFYGPNRYTAKGRELDQFLKTLPRSYFGEVYSALDKTVDDQKFKLPLVYIREEGIVFFIDNKVEFNHVDIVEITSTEFKRLVNSV